MCFIVLMGKFSIEILIFIIEIFNEILMKSFYESFGKLFSKVHGNISNTNHLIEDLCGPFKKNKGFNSATCVLYT